MDSATYFGPAGGVRKLWDPTGGILATRMIDTSVFSNKNGGARVIKSVDGAREYALNYGNLGRANFEWLNMIHQGHLGTGPFILIDPGRRNMLTVNQSSATSQLNSTRGFSIVGSSAAITSDATAGLSSFPKVLKYAFSAATPAQAQLLLTKPSAAWYGFPVIQRSYCFWAMVLGVTGVMDFNLQIRWMNAAGATVSTISSTTTTSSLTLAKKVSVAGVPPATALWAECSLVPVLATIALGEGLYLHSFQLQEGYQPDANWSPGTGIFPVVPTALPEKYGFAEPGMLVGPVLSLQEVV